MGQWRRFGLYAFIIAFRTAVLLILLNLLVGLLACRLAALLVLISLLVELLSEHHGRVGVVARGVQGARQQARRAALQSSLP